MAVSGTANGDIVFIFGGQGFCGFMIGRAAEYEHCVPAGAAVAEAA